MLWEVGRELKFSGIYYQNPYNIGLCGFVVFQCKYLILFFFLTDSITKYKAARISSWFLEEVQCATFLLFY
jgi:hypothetical protein